MNACYATVAWSRRLMVCPSSLTSRASPTLSYRLASPNSRVRSSFMVICHRPRHPPRTLVCISSCCPLVPHTDYLCAVSFPIHVSAVAPRKWLWDATVGCVDVVQVDRMLDVTSLLKIQVYFRIICCDIEKNHRILASSDYSMDSLDVILIEYGVVWL